MSLNRFAGSTNSRLSDDGICGLRDDVGADSGLEFEIDQESVFAHPQQRIGRHHRNTKHTPVGSPELTVTSVETITDDKQVVVGRVLPATDESKRARAPLAGFVSAT